MLKTTLLSDCVDSGRVRWHKTMKSTMYILKSVAPVEIGTSYHNGYTLAPHRSHHASSSSPRTTPRGAAYSARRGGGGWGLSEETAVNQRVRRQRRVDGRGGSGE
jgi:hypothetical protein